MTKFERPVKCTCSRPDAPPGAWHSRLCPLWSGGGKGQAPPGEVRGDAENYSAGYRAGYDDARAEAGAEIARLNAEVADGRRKASDLLVAARAFVDSIADKLRHGRASRQEVKLEHAARALARAEEEP
jgi:hypothetical protein